MPARWRSPRFPPRPGEDGYIVTVGRLSEEKSR